jgi:glycosyltransferase involved in cell wall biosynthesis
MPRSAGPAAEGPDAAPLTPAMLAVWHARPDLRVAFDISVARGRRDFRAWYEMQVATPADRRVPDRIGTFTAWRRRGMAWARARLPARVRRRAVAARHILAAARARLRVTVGRSRRRGMPPERAATAADRPGVRIVGNVTGESGMGNSLRAFATACAAAGVPHALVDSRVRHPSRQVALETGGSAAADANLRANILYMPLDQVGHALASLGAPAFTGRCNILVPFWELATCPAEWGHAAAFVDEIWAPTRFVAAAVAPLSARVLHLPPCVPEPRPKPLERAAFGLPRDAFLFFFSFDFFSFPERKNPLAAVAAFRAAFPRGSEPAGLIISAMNADARSPYWRRLRVAVDGDPRIRLLAGRRPHDEVLGLCQLADCYLSLHRAEGFGYGPAEAMLLGKPTVLTAYSGPLDYATSDNACLVDFTLVPVAAGAYAHHEGRVWAEPDIMHAAWHMRRLVDSPSLARALGDAGRDTIRAHHAPPRVGECVRERLQRIGVLDRENRSHHDRPIS